MTNANAVLDAFLLSLLAGFGTGLGGLIAVIRKPGKRSFGCLMDITAGVMITLSFLEMVNKAWKLQGFLTATIGFSAGAVFMLVIDILIPHIRFGERETTLFEQPIKQDVNRENHFGRHRRGHNRQGARVVDKQLLKTGTLLAIGITIHNIPEGIAVGVGYMHLPEFGLFIAMAILLHNIPEGIATAREHGHQHYTAIGIILGAVFVFLLSGFFGV